MYCINKSSHQGRIFLPCNCDQIWGRVSDGVRVRVAVRVAVRVGVRVGSSWDEGKGQK